MYIFIYMGRNIHGTNLQWDETFRYEPSWYALALGRNLHKQVHTQMIFYKLYSFFPLTVVQWNRLYLLMLFCCPSVTVRSLWPSIAINTTDLFSNPQFKLFHRFSISLLHFLYATQKVVGYYVIPSELWMSVRPSIRLSVSTSFHCSNFSTFWHIFFKLYIDIGIGEEWYGIASGIISFRNNIVMALDSCPKCIFAQYLKNE